MLSLESPYPSPIEIRWPCSAHGSHSLTLSPRLWSAKKILVLGLRSPTAPLGENSYGQFKSLQAKPEDMGFGSTEQS